MNFDSESAFKANWPTHQTPQQPSNPTITPCFERLASTSLTVTKQNDDADVSSDICSILYFISPNLEANDDVDNILVSPLLACFRSLLPSIISLFSPLTFFMFHLCPHLHKYSWIRQQHFPESNATPI